MMVNHLFHKLATNSRKKKLLRNNLTSKAQEHHPKEITAQKIKFSIKVSSVNVIKSVVSCGFGHIYWRNPQSKTSVDQELLLEKLSGTFMAKLTLGKCAFGTLPNEAYPTCKHFFQFNFRVSQQFQESFLHCRTKQTR